MNEFHHAPVDFIFTSPLNDSVLPPLRVSGDGVLREFGFVPGRGWLDAAMVWVLIACFGSLTYLFLEKAGRSGQQSLWGILMAWLHSLRKRRRVTGSLASDSPLAGVSQELAGAKWMHATHAMHAALKPHNCSVFIELAGKLEVIRSTSNHEGSIFTRQGPHAVSINVLEVYESHVLQAPT